MGQSCSLGQSSVGTHPSSVGHPESVGQEFSEGHTWFDGHDWVGHSSVGQARLDGHVSLGAIVSGEYPYRGAPGLNRAKVTHSRSSLNSFPIFNASGAQDYTLALGVQVAHGAAGIGPASAFLARP